MNEDRRSPSRHYQELSAEVIHRAVFEGSKTAFVRVYEHYSKAVRYQVSRAFYNMRNDTRSASLGVDDVCQDVWHVLLRRERGILRYYDRARGPFGRFIGHVAYQQALQRLERGSSAHVVSENDDVFEDERATEFRPKLILDDLWSKLVDRVDAELKANDRFLFRQHYTYHHTLRSIAKELGIPEGTLAQRHRRLKIKLAKMIEELLGEPWLEPSVGVVCLVLILLWSGAWGSWTHELEDVGGPGPKVGDDEGGPR